jgi:hypothetical protein
MVGKFSNPLFRGDLPGTKWKGAGREQDRLLPRQRQVGKPDVSATRGPSRFTCADASPRDRRLLRRRRGPAPTSTARSELLVRSGVRASGTPIWLAQVCRSTPVWLPIACATAPAAAWSGTRLSRFTIAFLSQEGAAKVYRPLPAATKQLSATSRSPHFCETRAENPSLAPFYRGSLRRAAASYVRTILSDGRDPDSDRDGNGTRTCRGTPPRSLCSTR